MNIPYGQQMLDESDIDAVVNVLKSEWLTQGKMISCFEEVLCAYTKAKYAVAVSSGTAALHLACLASNIENGSEVITTANSFVASANVAFYCGAKAIFVDIDKTTFNVDVTQIEEKITKHTKAIIPVHYGGRVCDMKGLFDIAQRYGLVIIEDAAHALGSQYLEDPVGSCRYSDMATFSFHPVKAMTTGEGGAIVTNSKETYDRLCLLRSHGVIKNENQLENKFATVGSWYYEMQELGFNYRITDIQCALGVSQLKKLNSFIKRRQNIVSQYDKAFKGNPYFDRPSMDSWEDSSWHLYPIRIKDKGRKKDIFETLRSKGIGVQTHYIPIYWHPYYCNKGYKKGLCPCAEDFYLREISIPVYPAMTDEDVRQVIETVKTVCLEVLS